MMFKKKKGSIVFAEKTSVYEVTENGEQLFQSIETNEDIFESLALYSKKLKKLSLKIYLKSYCFTTFNIDILEEDINPKDIPIYIEYSIKEKLEKDNLEDLFVKFFKIQKERYLVFIFDRDFIEELIEFIVNKGLSIENIFIQSNKEYSLDDYDSLIKKRNEPQKEIKIIIALVLLIGLIFSGITYYNFQLKEKIATENQKKISACERNDKIKFEQEKLEQDIESLNTKMREDFLRKELFKEKIYQLLQTVPEEVELERVYYEKNILTLQGNSLDKNSFFNFLNYLEKNDGVCNSRYDYFSNKNDFYNFLIEVEVL